MVVVHHCCQLGLGGKHITAPFYLCRHLGLFAITEYDMTALQSALKFYWLLGQVPWLQCVLQAGSLMGSPGALTSCTEVLRWGWGGGLSRGCWPLALRKSQGRNSWGAGLQVCVSPHVPDGRVTGCLVMYPGADHSSQCSHSLPRLEA